MNLTAYAAIFNIIILGILAYEDYKAKEVSNALLFALVFGNLYFATQHLQVAILIAFPCFIALQAMMELQYGDYAAASVALIFPIPALLAMGVYIFWIILINRRLTKHNLSFETVPFYMMFFPIFLCCVGLSAF